MAWSKLRISNAFNLFFHLFCLSLEPLSLFKFRLVWIFTLRISKVWCTLHQYSAQRINDDNTNDTNEYFLLLHYNVLTFQVSLVLSALQAGNKGTQACITAASAVSGIIADLDTTIMFASAGTLNPENEESFADHRCSNPATKSTNHLDTGVS